MQIRWTINCQNKTLNMIKTMDKYVKLIKQIKNTNQITETQNKKTQLQQQIQKACMSVFSKQKIES